MLSIFFSLISIGFLDPGYCSPQVIGWGIENSIGKSPYNPPWYDVKNETGGIYAGDDFSWPNNTVPYEFDYNATNLGGNITLLNQRIANLLRGMQIIMNTTCVRFVPRTIEPHYLFISFGTGGWSSVGYQHIPKQRMGGDSLTHELLHALGLVHEEARRDRDYYIAFNWTNLDLAYSGIYDLQNRPTFGTVLDPLSNMMLMGWFGHKDDKYPVSIYKDGTNGNDGFIHEFKAYSENDRQKINRRYKCNTDDSCWDEDLFNCPVWAKAGACKDSNWVQNQCQLLCCSDKNNGGKQKICKSSPKNLRSDCGYLGATLGCTNNTAIGGMTKYCRQSCGICERPSNYKLNPMIITKCTKTCNSKCNQNNGCNLSLPPNNPDFDQTKPVSQCKTLPAKSGLTTTQWCASSTWARKNCQTSCNIRQTCHPLCVDQDSNCPALAAKNGCFSLYN